MFALQILVLRVCDPGRKAPRLAFKHGQAFLKTRRIRTVGVRRQRKTIRPNPPARLQGLDASAASLAWNIQARCKPVGRDPIGPSSQGDENQDVQEAHIHNARRFRQRGGDVPSRKRQHQKLPNTENNAGVGAAAEEADQVVNSFSCFGPLPRSTDNAGLRFGKWVATLEGIQQAKVAARPPELRSQAAYISDNVNYTILVTD